MGITQFTACGRGRWAIENTLQWCLDIPFREDERRVRNRILADKVAWLKRFAISLLKQVNDRTYRNPARMAGWNPAHLLKVQPIPASSVRRRCGLPLPGLDERDHVPQVSRRDNSLESFGHQRHRKHPYVGDL